jgi:acyl-CoA synthetase (AMP-forming)/AMP-acid ligase II
MQKPASLWSWLETWKLTFSTMWVFSYVTMSLLLIQLRHVILRAFLCVFAWMWRNDNLSRRQAPSCRTTAALLEALDTLFRVSRLEAVDEQMLSAFEHQAAAVASRPASWSADAAGSDDAPPDAALINLSVEPGSSERFITFAGLVDSIAAVAQATAWELFRSGSCGVPVGSDGAKVVHTAAVLMHNSVDYIPVWAGVARSAPLLTTLHHLSSRDARQQSVYHHTCTALINTNLASNEMLFHALQCCDSSVLIVDVTLVGLVIDSGRICVPACTRRILLWKGSKSVAPSILKLLQDFNNANTALVGSESSKSAAHKAPVDLYYDVIARSAPEMDVPYGARDGKYGLLGSLASAIQFSHAQPVRLHRLLRALLRFQTTDPLLLIFTSGTTGLPKAARFIHLRFRGGILMSSFLQGREAILRLHKGASPAHGDMATSVMTVYNCLPMYHSAGGVFCTAHFVSLLQQQQRQARRDASLWLRLSDRLFSRCPPLRTARMIMRQKFSASNFVADLQQHRVTVVQYIGEVLRYATLFEETTRERRKMLVVGADDVKPGNTRNKQSEWIVPFAFGNGLRADVWLRAKECLHLDRIVEFYASTEGNVGFVNLFNEPHAIGHLPVFPYPFQCVSPIYWPVFPMRVLQYDEDSEAPWRDPSTNRCRCVGPNEVGEAAGQVAIGFDPFGLRRFDGYCDAAATRKKLITGVFSKNDVYFRSGDLVRFDERGFVSFVDRVGDTFRWKGENVSTLEVANALNRVHQGAYRIDDSVVYGVGVNCREGRAGMAKIRLLYTASGAAGVTLHEERVFMQDVLFGELSDSTKPSALPMYAIPVFIRIDDELAPSSRGGSVRSGGSPNTDTKRVSSSRSSLSRESHRGSTRGNSQSGVDDASMTETFKYRKVALAREAYQFYMTRHGAWQSRAYVLVPKKIVEEVAGYPPRLTSSWGYVPLDATTYPEYLGVDFKHCRW